MQWLMAACKHRLQCMLASSASTLERLDGTSHGGSEGVQRGWAHLRVMEVLDQLSDGQVVSQHLKGLRPVLRQCVVHVKADGLHATHSTHAFHASCTLRALLTQSACALIWAAHHPTA